MAKKRFVTVVTIDDPEDNIVDSGDAALWVELALGHSPTGKGAVVTVYSSAADAAADEAEKTGDFEIEAEPVPASAGSAPVPG